MAEILQAIDKMTTTEKISTMEYIWNALSSHYAAQSPSWHADVLVARRDKIDSGEAEFLSVDESESMLEESCCAG